MNPFFALFLESLERNSAKIAAVIDGCSISYQQLKHDIDRAAAVLATRFNSGDRVVFYASPSTALLSTLLGAFKADLVPAIIHQKFASNMLERMIENSAAKGLITDKGADEFPSGAFPEVHFVISPDLEMSHPGR